MDLSTYSNFDKVKNRKVILLLIAQCTFFTLYSINVSVRYLLLLDEKHKVYGCALLLLKHTFLKFDV
jgi:hypothetical protein